ncbi:MAG: hypothetical protein LBQ44_05585 [Treponema sp.]|nr:hypothetical protein [Treponema sp.]
MVGFAQSESDFEVKAAEGKVTITKYKGSVKNVVIPARIQGLPVTVIGYNAFFGSQVTSVTIGAGVTLAIEPSDVMFGGPSFDDELDAYYNTNGKKAGIYTKRGNSWSYSAR